MHTREDCLASLAANGCAKTGRNQWSDGTYRFAIRPEGSGFMVVAHRIHPPRNVNAAIRDALRPMFLAWRAEQAARVARTAQAASRGERDRGAPKFGLPVFKVDE